MCGRGAVQFSRHPDMGWVVWVMQADRRAGVAHMPMLERVSEEEPLTTVLVGSRQYRTIPTSPVRDAVCR